MVSEGFVTGDPVWAKMKGYPPWPAKVSDPPPDSKSPKSKKATYVYFFGTGDYAWITDENIIPHSKSMLIEARNRKKPIASYQKGIDALVSYSESYKKVKRPSKIIKKDTVENCNNVKKVVKVLNSVSKKYNNRHAVSKSLLKKAKSLKRKPHDFNGDSSKYSTKKVPNYEPYSEKYLTSLKELSHDCYSPFVTPKKTHPSLKTFGFIGLGMMGKHMVQRFLESGHKICVWNRTLSQCDMFVDMGAKKAEHPADLVLNCDIVFCCVSDADASKAVLFGENGVLIGFMQAYSLGILNKGYVEMSNIGPDTSAMISEAVLMRHGLYLEAPLYGTSTEAEEGRLIIIASGDLHLFNNCLSCFDAISVGSYYVGCEAGDALRMSVTMSALSGTMCAALAEAMVLVERLKLQKSHFLECLQHLPLANPSFMEKAQKMNQLSFQKVTALKYAQKDINTTLAIGHSSDHPMPIIAAANEIYKHGRSRNYSNEDMSAVYKVVKY